MFHYLCAVVSFLWLGLILLPPLYCHSLDTIQIKKISSHDQAAVIQTGEADFFLIRPGDIVSEHATVTDIQPDKIIIRYEGDIPETIILRVTGEGQRIERSRSMTINRSPLYRAQSIRPAEVSSQSDEAGKTLPEDKQQ
ncbi:MAG: hypothetical protein ACLFS7_10555 [Desulfosudaceae bacterium]